MKSTRLAIPEVILLEPQLFSDDRGYFYESFNQKKFSEVVGREVHFVQDNCSMSHQGVLRGLHYQVVHPQGKLVSVLQGEVFDVAVDVRINSPTRGQWVAEILSAENKKQLWIPEGFAHGFLVLSKEAIFQYKVTDYWYAQHERCLRYDDETLSIRWPDTLVPKISEKDSAGTKWGDGVGING